MVGSDGKRLLQVQLVNDFILVAVAVRVLLLIPQLEEQVVTVPVADGTDG